MGALLCAFSGSTLPRTLRRNSERERASIAQETLEDFSEKDRTFAALYFGEGMDPQDIATLTYRKLMNVAEEANAEVETISAENALKLIGDLYLARVHTAATARFYLPEWESAISRKLDIIASLYELLTDRLRTAQSQTMELIVIILILAEIILAIFKWV